MEENILAVIGIAISSLFGIVSLVYAFLTNRDKVRLEKLIQAELRGLAGNIKKIGDNTYAADKHFRTVQVHALKLERIDEVNAILGATQFGARDALAADHMIRNLLNQILTLQEGMFGTRNIEYYDSNKGKEVEQKD